MVGVLDLFLLDDETMTTTVGTDRILKLYCDGGVTGGRNPGNGVYWSVGRGTGEGGRDTEIVVQEGTPQYKTNNSSEYLALNDALLYAFEHREEFDRTIIHTDSQLIVNQYNGRWQCSQEDLIILRDKCRRNGEWLKQTGMDLDVVWVRRTVSVRRLGH